MPRNLTSLAQGAVKAQGKNYLRTHPVRAWARETAGTYAS